MNKATTIYEQTGWKRPYQQTICQELDVLDRITQHDFDLDDDLFVAYYKTRTGIDLKSEKSDWEKIQWALTSPESENWHRTSPDFVYLKPDLSGNPRMVPYGKDREEWISIHKRTRARLQDCWEIYCQQKKAA